jgi:SSS family solute:Na+ symporter
MTTKVIVLSVYALLIIGLGLVGMRRTRSFSDFFLGGRSVGPWMTAFTYATAYFSAVLFIGFAGKIGWGFGYSGLWIAVTNALVGVLGVWWLLGSRIREMSRELNIATMAEFFEIRYGSRFFKLFTAVSIFVFLIPYSAAVFKGLSHLFESNFGMSYEWALVLMGLFTAFYLVLGGYKSMTMIDTVFGVIMIGGVCILLGFTIQKGGGLAEITEGLTRIDARLTGPVGPPGWWMLFCLVFLTSAAPFAMPQLIQKFYAIKDQRSIRIGMVASTLFALLIGGVAYFTGATIRLLLSPDNAPEAFHDGVPIVDHLMPELLANVVPESLSVLMLLLILSASMSTLAALVLISSSAVVKDLYAGFMRSNVSDARLTLLMRICSAFFVALSVLLAYFRFDTIVAILGVSWGAIGSVFLGPFVWGLFWRRANRFGAISSAMLALATCLALYVIGLNADNGRPSSPEAGTIGMMVSLVGTPLLSMLATAVHVGRASGRGQEHE